MSQHESAISWSRGGSGFGYVEYPRNQWRWDQSERRAVLR